MLVCMGVGTNFSRGRRLSAFLQTFFYGGQKWWNSVFTTRN